VGLLAGRAALRLRLAVLGAGVPSPPELAVEGVQDAHVDLADRHGAEGGLDLRLNQAPVVVQGLRGDVLAVLGPPLDPLVEQLAHRRRPGALVLTLLDFDEQLALDALGLAATAVDLTALPLLASGQRVAARVDLDLEAASAVSDHGASPGVVAAEIRQTE
jgi:hypothetical protein